MREEVNESAQPLDLAGTTPTRVVANVVPAPMSEEVNAGESPHDLAWTTPTRVVATVVPAPRLELMFGKRPMRPS